VEQLEDRLVPSITGLTQLASLFPVHPGPTHLYLNFDGWHDATHNIAAFTGTDQDIQDILFRTAEIYSPFNVQVSRMFGDGMRDQGNNGNTTIFIGANSANVNANGIKYPYAFTPWASEDFPGAMKGYQHQPNSDPYDVAWVDPVGQNSTSWVTVWSDTQISEYISHEAGHTFGLVHTLTSSIPDLMSYDAFNQYFANHTFPITNLNNLGTQTVPDLTQQPAWQGTAILTQNSFTYLDAVLGPRPTDGAFHLADAGAIDPSLQTSLPLVSTISVGSPASGRISAPGDYVVYRFNSSTSGSIDINLLPTIDRTLVPVLLIHDQSGNLVQFGSRVWNAALGDYEVHTVFQPTPGQSYFLVVGSENGQAPSGYGHYDLSIAIPGLAAPSGAALRDTVMGRAVQSGQFWAVTPTGTSFANTYWGALSPGVTWVDVGTGDFNGDGKTDIAARDLHTGTWWVGISTGSSFIFRPWIVWNPNVTWVDVKVGDFTGDGKADIAGRVLQTGQWWVGESTGSSFINRLWTTWSPAVTWVDVNAGDFNGDGKTDLTGRVLQSGQWWVGESTGSSFVNSLWATWSPAVNWVDVKVGDFNGDGRADITGRVLQTGQWWTGISTGSRFATTLWDTWNPNVTWVDVQVGDFSGNGKSDLIGRVQQTGQWWAAYSNGSTAFANTLYASWSPAVQWADVQVGDFKGNGRDDIAARDPASGAWWTAWSNGTTGVTSLWATWSTGVTWVDVQSGVFT
jgi:hypothetical protein